MIPEKVYYKSNRTNHYSEIIKCLYENVNNERLRSNFSAPFVLFCGTFIEYMLNDLFIQHSNRYFKGDTQKQYLESFISMNFKAKLTCLLPILTNHELQLDIDSKLFKSLTEIITKRNKIAHGKDFFIGAIPNDIKEDGSFSIQLNTDKINDNPLDISLIDCTRYYECVFEFYNSIYIPYDESKHINQDENIIGIVKNNSKTETLNIENNC
jgi:hypothetical protein